MLDFIKSLFKQPTVHSLRLKIASAIDQLDHLSTEKFRAADDHEAIANVHVELAHEHRSEGYRAADLYDSLVDALHPVD